MKELLQELLSNIFEVTTTPKKKKVKSTKPTSSTKTTAHSAGQVWNTTSGYGAKNPDGKTQYFSKQEKAAADTYAKGGGRSPKEKPPEVKKPTRTQPPERIGSRGKSPAQVPTGAIKDLQAAANRETDPTKQKGMLNLLNAIQSGKAKQINKVISDLGLQVSAEGKLKATKLGGSSDKQKLGPQKGEGARNFASKIIALCSANGVEIPKVTTSSTITPSSTEQFKPSNTFKDQPPVELSVKVTDTGVEIGGVTIENVSEEQETVIADKLVSYAKKKMKKEGKEFTPEYEERIREYVNKRGTATRHNVTYLTKLTEAGEILPAHEFQGDEGKTRIIERVTDVVAKSVPKEKRTVVQSAIQKMGSAKNATEFNAAYQEFAIAIKGTPAEKGKKYLAESLTALRVVTLGGTALIPQSDSFPLADVLALKKSPITGEIDVDQILVDIESEQEVSAAGSVKEGLGAGSGNKPKIQNSRFNTGEVDGVDCSTVQEDLSSMCDMRGPIFTPTKNGDVTPEAKKQLMDYIAKYGPLIKAYYGIDEKMNDAKLYAFLSYGKELQCFEGKPAPGLPDKKTGKMEPYKQATSANGGQWRAWSVLGKITDAIHNRTVEQQYYHTVRYNGAVKVADGIRKFSKMKAQHLKNAVGVKGRPEFTRPDQELNAFTVPATIDETRNGNPCKE